MILSTVQEGQGSGDEPYSHDSDEECVVVLEGRLEVESAQGHGTTVTARIPCG